MPITVFIFKQKKTAQLYEVGLKAGRYGVRIPVPALTHSEFIRTQWVGVRPLHPLLFYLTKGGL
jgi:hypothetical protein